MEQLDGPPERGGMKTGDLLGISTDTMDGNEPLIMTQDHSERLGKRGRSEDLRPVQPRRKPLQRLQVLPLPVLSLLLQLRHLRPE